jgi:hypothetical protein
MTIISTAPVPAHRRLDGLETVDITAVRATSNPKAAELKGHLIPLRDDLV